MRTRAAARRLLLALAPLIVGPAGGCGTEPPPNLSPTAEQDPARFEEAKRITEEMRRKNLEAERNAMKRLRTPRPPH